MMQHNGNSSSKKDAAFAGNPEYSSFIKALKKVL